MNTFRNRMFGRAGWLTWFVAGVVAAVCFTVSASALDPNRMMSRYTESSWGSEKGFSAGSVAAIAQTTDGYLWIGTDKGLFRFDGLNFRQFGQANSVSLAIGPVQTLLADGRGNLWILLRSTKLLRYHDGTFELSRGEAENGITAMGPGTGDAVLLSSLALGTLAYNGKQFITVSSTPVFADSAGPAHEETPDERSTRLSWSTGLTPHRLAAPTSAVVAMAATADGRIWLGTQDRGLFYLQNGGISPAANGFSDLKVNCVLPLGNSELWIGTNNGVLRWSGTALTRDGVPPELSHVEVLSLLRDRDSNLWAGTARGLLRVNASGVSSFARGSFAGKGVVNALFEDREGNIWIGGPRGLERLRDSAFVTYSVPGLKSPSMGPLYVGADDHVWVAPIEGGLRWLNQANGRSLQVAGLAGDIVYSIAGRGDDLWLGRQRGGLTHLHDGGGSSSLKSYTKADGLAQNSVFAVYESRDGTVWAGTLSGGVSELRKGHFTTYTTANGLASDTVSSIAEDADATMWFGTPNGLTAMSKRGVRTYTTKDGLSSSDVNCLYRDSGGVLWIGTAAGLAYLNGGRIHVPEQVPPALREPIFGIAEDAGEWLWIATSSHVLQVKSSSLLGDALNEGDVRDYGVDDGLLGNEGVKRYQSVVADSRGNIWFSTNRGLSVVNPTRATANPVPPLVHIEAILADGTALDLHGPIRVPGGKQRTTFRYVGLSLSNSERIRYRYKLDGFDHGWSEPVTHLEATYGNLGAGTYRFRVMASNGGGLWNGSEAALGFEVEPTLWQTWWFRLACVLCAGSATLLAYRLRMHQLTQLLNVRFEERLAERTRIAQELHDNFLQGLLSVSMQLQVAMEQLPDDSPARAAMNRVVGMMGPVIEEGRNAIRGLRSSIENADDLTNSFSQIPQEWGEQRIDFRLVVEGSPLPLRSRVRDEVYRIGREALVNAFRHSGASNVNLYLEYAAQQFRILVQDDGCGIEPQVLRVGRDGHWGLSGMRERAEGIGGKLRVMSRLGGGTEVELRVPNDIAFESPPSSRTSKWLTSLHRPQKDELTPK